MSISHYHTPQHRPTPWWQVAMPTWYHDFVCNPSNWNLGDKFPPMHLCNRIEMTFLLARSGTKKRFALFNLSAMLMGISMASDSTREAYEPEIQCFDLFRASKTRSSPYLHLSPLCPWGERNTASPPIVWNPRSATLALSLWKVHCHHGCSSRLLRLKRTPPTALEQAQWQHLVWGEMIVPPSAGKH